MTSIIAPCGCWLCFVCGYAHCISTYFCLVSALCLVFVVSRSYLIIIFCYWWKALCNVFKKVLHKLRITYCVYWYINLSSLKSLLEHWGGKNQVTPAWSQNSMKMCNIIEQNDLVWPVSWRVVTLLMLVLLQHQAYLLFSITKTSRNNIVSYLKFDCGLGAFGRNRNSERK